MSGPRNPGDPDPRQQVERVIRVDQAGEFGAVRIYEGQLAALRMMNFRRSTPAGISDGICVEGSSGSRSLSLTSSLVDMALL